MDTSDPLLNVVLYAPRIPQNTGQIARTCLAMGLRLHLIRPLGFRIDDAALRRAAVGHWDALDSVVHSGGDEFWNAVPDRERAFLISKFGRRAYTDVEYARGDWIVLGNETEGLPQGWLDAAPGRTLQIPMKNPEARCLNLATAATAVVFEALRQIELSESRRRV